MSAKDGRSRNGENRAFRKIEEIESIRGDDSLAGGSEALEGVQF